MLEHLTRLQSRLLNHRASLAEATTALQSGKTLTVPFSEILEPFFSDTHQVADIAVYLNTQGSRFRHREKLLKTLSVDTSCLLLCAPVMLMLDLYKQLLSLVDAALAEGKPRSLFTAAENPACSCCSAISRITWTDLAPPNLVFSAGAYPPESSAAGPSTNTTNTTAASSASASSASASASSTSTTTAPAPAPSPTPILDAFAKLPERIGGFAMSNSSSSSLSPGLRLWSLVGTLEFEVARLSQAVRLVEEKFPLLTIRGILKHTIASMREEMDAVLKIVGEVRGRCVVL
ncbi:Peroxisomal membrane anchor protein (Pex14) [Lasiodiplodia theobromae]|uniref:Peroxisomal membrane anchor protein (Pex14) n=1 Tax=Lasiodiplodia theobromae TaxID=45133 RepID=UPI0015C38077|nr:Peroxisomal membrane anchor protein (Pex14) [Lasiodiplodia theobromae]KAF4537716.1 Peroxisomal membrane anchor protein (Pex14) [Lasiodiplodia theobromae]